MHKLLITYFFYCMSCFLIECIQRIYRFDTVNTIFYPELLPPWIDDIYSDYEL